jgi:hypothetical protein
MMGFELTEGELKDNAEANLFSCLSQSLFRGAHANTYKYGLLKAILDNIFSVDADYRLSMDDINATFAKVYWNLVNIYHVPQSPISLRAPSSSMEQLVRTYSANHTLDLIPFDSLAAEHRIAFLKKSKPILKKYVFGAFYGDTNGYLFGFSKATDALWLNEKSFRFLSENKVLLDQINYYEWLKMCESILAKAQSRVDNLSTVLENITERVNLDYFKDELNKLGKNETCFYCGKHLAEGAPLDHVIPWDFLKQDQLWDLVFACPSCNSSKNDKVPDQAYLDKLIERNKRLGIESPDILSLVKTAELNGVVVGWKPKNDKD